MCREPERGTKQGRRKGAGGEQRPTPRSPSSFWLAESQSACSVCRTVPTAHASTRLRVSAHVQLLTPHPLHINTDSGGVMRVTNRAQTESFQKRGGKKKEKHTLAGGQCTDPAVPGPSLNANTFRKKAPPPPRGAECACSAGRLRRSSSAPARP